MEFGSLWESILSLVKMALMIFLGIVLLVIGCDVIIGLASTGIGAFLLVVAAIWFYKNRRS